MSQLESIEKYAALPYPIHDVTEDNDGNLYVVCLNGDVMIFKDGKPNLFYTAQGQPTSIAFDEQNLFFLADPLSQNIISQSQNEALKIEITTLVKDYEGAPLAGPNMLTYSDYLNTLFFTDSGPLGCTSFENPKGSVFSIDFEINALKPLAYKCLAYPTGIAVSEQGYVYVSETCKNRIIRFVRNASGTYNYSAFYQFSGKFGPTAISFGNGLMFVSRFDFNSPNGMISVLSQKGELMNDIVVDGLSEITGLCISKTEENAMYIAGRNMLLKAKMKFK
jgi:sugar lactone lactonase YvrE